MWLWPDDDQAALTTGLDMYQKCEHRHDRLEDVPIKLGTGEIAGIVLADNRQCSVVLGDKLARHHAQAKNVSVVGMVGVPLFAKQCGRAFSVDELLDRLKASGYFLLE